MTELEGWISLVHPEILVEFDMAKKKDPYLITAPSSQAYVGLKQRVDELIDESGLEFEQRPFNSKYPENVGYYYQGELAFKYCRLCIESGHNPRLTYWGDFMKHTNREKEGICYDEKYDCHETIDHEKIIGGVQFVINQIKSRNAVPSV